MFGSLVVVLPTKHEGGTLILRHGGEEWKFESDAVPPSSITYAAFYGDVEHEVTEVKSGYRLSLTYNLYFGTSLDSQSIISTPTTTTTGLYTPLPPNAVLFQNKLSELLSDETFLPMGGRLGFGLFHEYPFNSEPNLRRIAEVLKGSDATIMQACRAFGLDCVLNVCYQDQYDDEDRTVALCPFVPNIDGDFLQTALWEYLKDLPGVMIANSDSDDEGKGKKMIEVDGKKEEGEGEEIDLDSRDDELPSIDVFVHWVTKQTAYNAFESHMVTYGNEPSLSHNYGKVCLIVSVGPPGRRSEKPLKV